MPKNSKGKEVAEVNSKKCTGCQACIAECPVECISIVDGVAKIDGEKCIGCGKCYSVCPADAIIFDKPVKKKAAKKEDKEAAEKLKEYEGVAVYIEVHKGVAADVSWELVGKGKELADKLKTKVIGFLIAPETKKIAEEAIAFGCDEVYTIENELFAEYKSKLFGDAATDLCSSVKPEIFLIGASPLGRDLASVIATKLQTGLTADCTGLDIVSGERNLMMTRPTFGGNIMATILCKNHRPQMSTVRPKVMKMPSKDSKRKGQIISHEYQPVAEEFPRIIKKISSETEGAVDITQAPVLVVVGKGACESKNYEMIEELASLLGGTIACSRPVVESGILPSVRQVGQTGKTVAPKIYIGIGVSGAVQHLVGMQGSEKVICINVDKNAPMVQIADYSIIGDYAKIVPQLIKGLKEKLPNLKTVGSK